MFKRIKSHPFTQYVLGRAKERSTWRGVAALVATFGIVFSPEAVEYFYLIFLGVAGVVEIVAQEKPIITRKEPEE